MKIPKSFEAKGLICFEEITDYSILDQKKTGKKRKLSESDCSNEDTSNKNVKKKLILSSKAPASIEGKVKGEKKIKKAVKFNETLQVKSFDQNEKSSKKLIKNKKKIKKEKLKNGTEKITKKKKKENKPNSTSRISLHSIKENDDYDEKELEEKMSAWSDMILPKVLLRGLYEKGFYEPMPIQKLVVPAAIKNKSNIIGTAQTGSGKTLAFGLPILTHLIDSYEANNDVPQALILTPTRELAIQIKDHLQACCKFQKTKIIAVVGGISQVKQERLLKKKPEIVVATPGRLAQLIDEGNEYLSKISYVKYLVIDEADRMIEKGHFGEMEKILGVINSDEKMKLKRQNFLFSATLITKFNSAHFDEADEKTDAQLKKEHKALLNSLVEKLQMTKEPVVFDLTTKAVTAENLIESKIFCSLKDKDAYLYYFMCKYSGRTLVFANSIDCVRRLTNLFRLMKKNPLHLHADMNQKQRLKNLEKFNAQENSLLIASDVASRGLDIPGVMHVIHYQVPRSAEIYVHRSGRTARAVSEGLSVMLISPDELNLYKKILKTFKNEKDLKDYPIDRDYYEECKSRIALARKIDELEHQLNKEKSTTNWYEKHAKMLDIDLDDEILKETQIDQNQLSKNKNKLKQLKLELDQKLKSTIYPKFMSKNYVKKENIDKVLSLNQSNKSAIVELKEAKVNKKIKKFKKFKK